jgi:hypothetical protein
MVGDTTPPEDLDAVMTVVRQRVAAKRAAGEYPADLEERLSGHFDRIRLLRADEDHLEPVRLALEELERRTQFSLAHNTSSRNPLGERYHRLMADAVTRQVEPLVGQVRAYVDQLREVFRALIDRLDDPGSHVHADLLGQIDAALDRLGQLHAMPADPAPRVTDSPGPAPRVTDSPGPASAGPSGPAWVDASDLQSFRLGTSDQVEERLTGLVPHLAGVSGPALGIDVGRGELVALLARSGVLAEGWEAQRSLVKQASGLVIRTGDGLDALADAAERSLGAVVLPDPTNRTRLADAVALAPSRLRPGGHVLVTGVDPDAAGALGRHLRADPRNAGWIYPETVELLCRQAGFGHLDRWQADGRDWVRHTETEPAQLFAVLACR